jgi:two-component system OmpR family sensor kinase
MSDVSPIATTTPAKRFPAGLVLRIYGIGILQFALVAAGVVLFVKSSSPPLPPRMSRETAHVLALALAPKLHDMALVTAELAHLERSGGWAIALYDAQHKLLSSTQRIPVAGPPGPGIRSISLTLADGTQGSLVCNFPRPPPPPALWFPIVLVLTVVGATSWFTARALARPLLALSRAASAFGEGLLTVRADATRKDELGDVARSFNEMAERISSLLRTEKELMANVSHELRTPLARIQVALDLASEGDAENARESLGEIAEDLAELTRIVDDVLTATRLSLRDGFVKGSAVPPIRLEQVDLQALLERSAGRFRTAHPGRPLQLQFGSVLPDLQLDAVLFRRVIDNLLENADKYSDNPATPIIVFALRNGSRVICEVRDQGIGVAPDDLERVFEPFFRADRSRSRATGGYGLGLALARRIVEAHAGSLRLMPGAGAGTIARVELPIRAS